MTDTSYVPRVWNTNEHLSTSIHPYKYIKGSMGKLYPYSSKLEINTVVVIHNYGARAIFLLFYDNQDTLST